MRGPSLPALFLGLVLSTAAGGAEAWTIATYNIENYGSVDRLTEAGYRQDYPKPEAEKAALRAVIRGLGADLLVLQEMGSQGHLDELRRDLRGEGLDYAHAVLLAGPDTERHVAILSKWPLTAVVPHPALEFPYLGGKERVKRGLLEARVALADGEVTIFAVHLKSRFTDRSDDAASTLRRLGEAVAIRDLILQRFPDPATARFLIAGDFNDSRSSKTLQRLLQRGETKIARLLTAEDSRGEKWTHAYRKEESYSRVDYVLVSPGLFPSVRGGVARIYDGEGVRNASDHRPVLVTLVPTGQKKEAGSTPASRTESR